MCKILIGTFRWQIPDFLSDATFRWQIPDFLSDATFRWQIPDFLSDATFHWQIPDFLSDGNSIVCIFSQFLSKSPTEKCHLENAGQGH